MDFSIAIVSVCIVTLSKAQENHYGPQGISKVQKFMDILFFTVMTFCPATSCNLTFMIVVVN